MPNVKIRPFQVADRSYVRAICCDGADRGEPIERFFFDREIAADLLTCYYTDYEPASSFVAEHEGKVVGYINGCLDNRRYGLVMFWILTPGVLIKAFKHGTFLNKIFWQMLWGMMGNWPRLFAWRKQSFHSHQGHMHIGIAKEFRGQHLGRQLMEAFFTYAAPHSPIEMTVSVHDGNIPACRFFEHLGFTATARYPMVMMYNGSLQHYHSIYYVKTI